MRLLFVDDEPNVLRGLWRSLFVAGVHWDLHEAGSADAALSKLAERSFDAVVTDMRMPETDGAALLRIVCQRWPQTLRVVFSGQADERAMVAALAVSHQFIAKPCDTPRLVASLERLYASRRWLARPEIQALVSGVQALPAAPGMYLQLRALFDRGQPSPDDVLKLLARDPAMSARVLRFANTLERYDLRAVEDLATAVAVIGMPALERLVLAAEVFDEMHPIGHLRRTAMAAAVLAERLAPPGVASGLVSTAALLADVGYLLKLRRTDFRFHHPPGGADLHAEMGAYLLARWGLPEVLTELVAQHHQTDRLGDRLDAAGVLHIALSIANGHAPDADYVHRIGMTSELPAWQRIAESMTS